MADENDSWWESIKDKHGKTLSYAACIICSIIIIVGFGIAELVIYTDGTSHYPASQACGTFPDGLTNFTAEKKVFSQWHWDYSYTSAGLDGRIVLNCPTLKKDVKVYNGGSLVMKSDGKIATTISLTYLQDCHGKTIYLSRTADTFETIVNGNKILISFELRSADDKQTLAYVDATRFFSDSVDIKDPTGAVVANMKRNTWAIPWVWQFTIYKQNQPGSNPAVLSLIAGKLAFSDNDKTDTCNSFFYNVAWMLLAVAILLFCVCGFLIWATWSILKDWILQYTDCCGLLTPDRASDREPTEVTFHNQSKGAYGDNRLEIEETNQTRVHL